MFVRRYFGRHHIPSYFGRLRDNRGASFANLRTHRGKEPELGVQFGPHLSAFAVVWNFPLLYPVHVSTRKSFGLMTRKLSVTESRKLLQFLGTLSRKKSSVTSANCPHVA